MFIVTVEFTVNDGHEGSFRTAILAQAANSLSREADCHQFDVCFAPESQCRVFLYEVYTDEAAFEAHQKTPHFGDFSSKVESWVADKKVTTWLRAEA